MTYQFKVKVSCKSSWYGLVMYKFFISFVYLVFCCWENKIVCFTHPWVVPVVSANLRLQHDNMDGANIDRGVTCPPEF